MSPDPLLHSEPPKGLAGCAHCKRKVAPFKCPKACGFAVCTDHAFGLWAHACDGTQRIQLSNPTASDRSLYRGRRSPVNPLDRIRAYVPAVVRQNQEFQTAVDDELDAEVALLQEAIDLARPALPYLGGPMPNGARGLLIRAETWLGEDGVCYGWVEPNRSLEIGPITLADVLDTRGALQEALEALASALERDARGKLAKRSQQATERAQRLRAIVTLIAHRSGEGVLQSPGAAKPSCVQLLSGAEVARRVGLTRQAVHEAWKAGRITAMALAGSTPFYDERAVQFFLDNRQRRGVD